MSCIINSINIGCIKISTIIFTSWSLQSPLGFLQWLSFVKARTCFTMVFENFVSLNMNTQIVVLQKFARRITIVVG